MQDLKIAVMADLHMGRHPEDYGCNMDVDKVKGPDEKLKFFIEEAENEGCDAILQLGDFARDFNDEYQRSAVDIWHSFDGHRLSVRGNHDGQKHSLEKYLEAMNMPDTRYKVEINGWKFIIWNSGRSSDKPLDEVEEGQTDWIESEINSAQGRCILAGHHLHRFEEETDIYDIIKRTNKKAGYRKTLAVFWGHRHYRRVTGDVVDRLIDRIDGTWIYMLNSMHYRWVPGSGARLYGFPPPFAIVDLKAWEDGSVAIRAEGYGEKNNWLHKYCDYDHDPADNLTYQKSLYEF